MMYSRSLLYSVRLGEIARFQAMQGASHKLDLDGNTVSGVREELST
jgi:hypothetical protein